LAFAFRYCASIERASASASVIAETWLVCKQRSAFFASGLPTNRLRSFSPMFSRSCATGGKMLSQFDLLIAAVARQQKLTLLTADRDFQPVTDLKVKNWL
jgi:hypothetical protein